MLLGKIEEFCHAQQLIRPKTDKTTGLSHCGLVIYIKKYLKAKKEKKEELWKLKYFIVQKYNLQKNPLKQPKSFKIYHNSIITNLKFQHKPKYHLSKILIEK
jgi:hypothetical protein